MRHLARRHREAGLALLVLVAGATAGWAAHDPAPRDCGLAIVLASCVAFRTRRPILSLSVVQALGVAVTATHLAAADTAGFVLADLVLVYTAAARQPARPAVAALVVSLAAFWSEDAMLGHRFGEYAASAALVGVPWAVGRYVRRERELRAALSAAVEAERVAMTATAAARERERIAREMHQIVAHGLAAIAVQGSAAEAALTSDPDLARDPVRAIKDTAHRSCDEMRLLLSVLRSDSSVAATVDEARVEPTLRAGAFARYWAARDVALTGIVLTLGIVAAALAPHDQLLTAGLAGVAAAPVVVRRRCALLGLCVECALAVGLSAVRPVPALGPALAVAALSMVVAAAVRRDRTAAAALALGLGGFWSGDAFAHHSMSEYFASAVTVGGAWLIGAVVGHVAELRARATAATKAQRAAVAVGAAAEERRRLAREMHDVVAHGLSAIAVQSGAADAALPVDAARALTAVRTVASLSRQCGAEMRHLLDLLGEDESPAPLRPDLQAVLSEQTPLGLVVDAQIEQHVIDCVSTALDQAITRIVQESLTNVRRHSRARSAQVRVWRQSDSIRIRVTDEGPSKPSHAPPGYGTAGIRERASALGGTCSIGPRKAGWCVDVSLPVPARVRPRAELLGEPA